MTSPSGNKLARFLLPGQFVALQNPSSGGNWPLLQLMGIVLKTEGEKLFHFDCWSQPFHQPCSVPTVKDAPSSATFPSYLELNGCLAITTVLYRHNAACFLLWSYNHLCFRGLCFSVFPLLSIDSSVQSKPCLLLLTLPCRGSLH